MSTNEDIIMTFHATPDSRGHVETALETPLDLENGAWEVALVDFVAPRRFTNVHDSTEIAFYCEFSTCNQALIDTNKATDHLQYGFVVLVNLVEGQYDNIHDICRKINADFKQKLYNMLLDGIKLETKLSQNAWSSITIGGSRQQADEIFGICIAGNEDFNIWRYNTMENKVILSSRFEFFDESDAPIEGNPERYTIVCTSICIENTQTMANLGLLYRKFVITENEKAWKERHVLKRIGVTPPLHFAPMVVEHETPDNMTEAIRGLTLKQDQSLSLVRKGTYTLFRSRLNTSEIGNKNTLQEVYVRIAMAVQPALSNLKEKLLYLDKYWKERYVHLNAPKLGTIFTFEPDLKDEYMIGVRYLLTAFTSVVSNIPFKSKWTCTLRTQIPTYFVYTSLVAPQIIADNHLSFLRTVHNMDSGNCRYSLSPFQYRKIACRYINRIEIVVADGLGETIPFTGGVVSYTLHLRIQKMNSVDSMYVQTVSNGCKEAYPDNSAGHFINNLPCPMQLADCKEWEIALINAQIPKAWATIDNSQIYATFEIHATSNYKTMSNIYNVAPTREVQSIAIPTATISGASIHSIESLLHNINEQLTVEICAFMRQYVVESGKTASKSVNVKPTFAAKDSLQVSLAPSQILPIFTLGGQSSTNFGEQSHDPRVYCNTLFHNTRLANVSKDGKPSELFRVFKTWTNIFRFPTTDPAAPEWVTVDEYLYLNLHIFINSPALLQVMGFTRDATQEWASFGSTGGVKSDSEVFAKDFAAAPAFVKLRNTKKEWLNPVTLFHGHRQYAAAHTPSIYLETPYIQLETDIVDNSIVGGGTKPLLRTIFLSDDIGLKSDSTSQNELGIHYVNFEKPIYVPLRLNYLSSIEITAKRPDGKDMLFKHGVTNLTLHLRRRHRPY